ncbi:MAG TPA: DUF6502 family protein [Gammaproteobacteria bacterium]
MNDDLQTILEKAASRILRPLVRVMLRNGIACGSFEEMVRKAYVDEAFALAEKEGKATVSAVSAQTGLSRKEVKRLNEIKSEETSSNSQKYNRAIRVISGWMNDPRFISDEGVSKPLNMEGSDQSFATLVKDYSGDIPTRAMFDLLHKSGCVEQLDGKVCLISHAYVPGNDPVDVINILGADTHELMNTVIHNMSCEKQQRRFQRKVSTSQLADAHVEDFKKYAGRRSQALLEDLDNWLSKHQSQADDEARYVSLGIYFYQEDSDKETKS